MSSQDEPAASCPVDHKTREAWLAQARASNSQPQNLHDDNLSQPQSPQPQSQPQQHPPRLATDREVSTIPRALPSTPQNPATPANNERDTGTDKATGNWIYPSERMFFDAMLRKSHNPSETDMATIVPIHNAVNERAWAEIRAWEAGQGSEACGGPRLESFSGEVARTSPRARWRGWMGYTAPFDRHDWVVDRCGVKVEYVIDFYAGKGDGGVRGKGLSFYLDVRPKLNSWEGWRMRFGRFWGL
ncbi:cytochrome c/c1 heme-lyase [Phaeosphaeriaceae sp. PMI808]|nr:cytochrome c/c1 heme-lyase [Phaeosphaeriaceae sp. PMI808]